MRPVWTFSEFSLQSYSRFRERSFFQRCGERWQMRCRLILLITEHPIQQGIRKVKSSLLANLRSSQLANYWTVRKCLFSMCFSPFSAIFFAFTPFKYTHNTNFEKKCSPGLDFLSTVKAQTFCRNSGRVATAYSTDKYKYQNMKIRVSWVGQSSRGGGGQPKRSAWPLFSCFFYDSP